MFKKIPFILFALMFVVFFTGCVQTVESPSDKVRVHFLSDIQHLNPITATDASSTIAGFQTHQYLYGIDPYSYEYVPVLAKERATVGEVDGKVTLDYEIRPEATWDNGSPITAEDVAFSLKLYFTPDVETMHVRPYMDYIEDIIIDESNPKKFRVICKRPYMSAETSIATNMYIMPAYVYDSENVLKDRTVKEFLSDDEATKKKLEDDQALKDYAAFFNGQKFQREVNVGSGPYAFTQWDTNQRLVLTKKDNWWGDKVNAPNNPWFTAHPNEITYVTINDLQTAVVAMKGQSIDAMHSIPNKQFVEDLQQSEDFKSKYYLGTPPLFSYDYIAINTRDERLEDVRVRKALAHLMNVDELIKTELYGLGQQVTSFVHPLFTQRLNTDIKPYAFNIERAKEILAEAGWKDTDGDGIVDKEIDGEKRSLKLRMDYNNGNSRRETSCIIFKDACKKAGVEIEILPLEWATYLDKHKKHDFDLFVAGWVASPVESDPKQIWHTESYDGGSNYVGFGTPETDALIEKLRVTVNDQERFGYYKELQSAIHEDVPYIFLISQKNRIATSKKFDRAHETGLRSGMFPNGMKPNPSLTAQ